jgi:hypothetical protein
MEYMHKLMVKVHHLRVRFGVRQNVLNGLYFGSQLMENKYELIMIENET